MRQITMILHHEGGTWWAESPDLPGFSALAPSLDELRQQVREGVAFELDDAPHLVLETAWSAAETSSRTAGASAANVPVEHVGYKASTLPRGRGLNARLALA